MTRSLAVGSHVESIIFEANLANVVTCHCHLNSEGPAQTLRTEVHLGYRHVLEARFQFSLSVVDLFPKPEDNAIR
jgi:hypothetical protein